MPLVRVSNGGKPTLVETTLWTNSNSSAEFAAKTVTLSSSMDNFAFLRFYCGNSRSAECSVTKFKTYSASGVQVGVCIRSNSHDWVRRFYYSSVTKVGITSCGVIAYNDAVSNTTLIPTKITGLKYE